MVGRASVRDAMTRQGEATAKPARPQAPLMVDGDGRVGRLIEYRRAEGGKAGLAVLRDDLMRREWTADPSTVRPASPR